MATEANRSPQVATFWEAIRRLREQGLIPRVWSRADIRPHLHDQFAENTITTVPSNASMARDGLSMGDYVKKGAAPMAWRVARGRFELVDDPEGEADNSGARTAARARKHRLSLLLDRDVYEQALALAAQRGTSVETVARDALVHDLRGPRSLVTPVEMPVNHASSLASALSPADVAGIMLADELAAAGLAK